MAVRVRACVMRGAAQARRSTLARAVLLVACACCVATGVVASDTVDADSEFAPFLEWFASIGGVANGVSLGRFQNMGTGVKAVADVHEGDVVLSVPLTHVVCRKSLEAKASAGDAMAAALVAAFDHRSDEDLVGAWLMLQRHLGEASESHAYIQALPTHVPLPNTFTTAELKELEEPKVSRAARQRVAAAKSRLAAAVVPALEAALPGEDRTAAEWLSTTSLDTYLWAVNLVGSRALTIQGRKYLVPFADMFNYAPHHQHRDADSGANFLKYHRLGDHTFDVVADREAPAGTQLFEDYGDNDNTLYLSHHGFVAADNPFDCVELRLPAVLPRHGKLGRDKRKLLEAMRVNLRGMDTCSRADRRISYPVHVYMAVAAMDADAIERCRAIIDGSRDRSLLGTCFGPAFVAQDALQDAGIRAGLASAVAAHLDSYTTTLAEDDALLASPALNEHQRLAVTFRRTRKLLLHDLLAVVDPAAASDRVALTSEQRGDTSAEGEGVVEVEVKVQVGTEDVGAVVDLAEEHVAADASPGDAVAHVTDRPRTDAELQAIVHRFNAWLTESQPSVHAIKAQWVGGGMRVGVVATRDVATGEVYLAVPEPIIMSRASARRSRHLKALFAELDAMYPRGDAFHELLIHLMYEAFVLGHRSRFAPYLDIIPNKAEIGGPVFWGPEDLSNVRGSESYNSIIDYNRTMDKRYGFVKTAVFDKFPQHLPPAAFTRDNYRWAYGILDSRSIWWNSERHLVPLLDLINCAEGPDPTAVHSTTLDSTGQFAETRAAWDFPSGSQLFENYGQPNHIYFEYHGFALQPNSHDCVQVRGFTLPDDLDGERRKDVLSRLRRLGINGDRESTLCLAAPPQPQSDRVRHYLELVHGASTQAQQLEVLRPLAQAQLDRYDTSIADDEALLAGDGAAAGGVGSRQWNAIRFRLSEKRLLAAIAR